MSETLRIREAARVLHRQRPDDTREGSILASYSPPTAAEMADKYRELAQRAAMDLQRRIKGLEGLFGGEVAQPLDAAAEGLREAFYAALDQQTQHATICRDLCRDRDNVDAVLAAALADFDRRQARTAPARRKPEPEWVRDARNRSPF